MFSLSSGQQQQLAIARALVVNPRLYEPYEPTEGIQPNVAAEIGAALKLLKQEKAMSIWIVERKLPLIQEITDPFHILNRGEDAHSGAIESLVDASIQTYLTVQRLPG